MNDAKQEESEGKMRREKTCPRENTLTRGREMEIFMILYDISKEITHLASHLFKLAKIVNQPLPCEPIFEINDTREVKIHSIKKNLMKELEDVLNRRRIPSPIATPSEVENINRFSREMMENAEQFYRWLQTLPECRRRKELEKFLRDAADRLMKKSMKLLNEYNKEVFNDWK